MNKNEITNPTERAIADKYFGTPVGSIRLAALDSDQWAAFVSADETERQKIIDAIVADEDTFPAQGFRDFLVRFVVAVVVAFAVVYAPKFFLHLNFMQSKVFRIILEVVLFCVAVMFVPKIAVTKDPRKYGIHRRKLLIVLYKIMLCITVVGIIVCGFFAMKVLLPLLDEGVSQQEKVALRYDMYWFFSLGVAFFVGFLCMNGEMAVDAGSCRHCDRINCVAVVKSIDRNTPCDETNEEQQIVTNVKKVKHTARKAKCLLCGSVIGFVRKRDGKSEQ